MAYRVAVLLLATTLASLVLNRGYGLEPASVASGETIRRTQGDWQSVPFKVDGERAPQEVQLTVDPSACARVVRYQVAETIDAVHVTVWRRQMHSTCAALTVVVRLRAPLAGRPVLDGGEVIVR